MSESRERLDVLLIKRGLFESRERARENIILGNIYVNDIKVCKCGKKIEDDVKIEFKGEKLQYVSRGGLKIEKAIELFNIGFKNKICIDIGASTGGFTDCMLQNGASKVFAIDVGSNQLHEKLKKDSRVISIENLNARYITVEDINEYCDFASVDVSFISITKVILSIVKLLNDNGEIVILIKPQFEAGKSNLNKKGVVKDKKVHIDVIYNIINFVEKCNLKIKGLDFSPVKGPNGNIEYLLYATKNMNYLPNFKLTVVKEIVDKAQEKLK
jgi:23S rRNA (cytidine1920-2'-O)/16S rRNA (cytidine1409-2'-O)-methyltransferase